MAVVVIRALKEAALNALDAATMPLNGAVVGLFTNDHIPTEADGVADYTLETGDGLEEKTAVTWTAAYEDTDGTWVVQAVLSPFISGVDPDPPVIIYGWVAMNTAKSAVTAAERFETPVTIQQSGEGLSVLAKIPWGG